MNTYKKDVYILSHRNWSNIVKKIFEYRIAKSKSAYRFMTRVTLQ